MSTKDIFIFVGPPGSGKGTLSQYCEKELGWYPLSTGDLCRKHIKAQTDIGKHIEFAIKSGKLIDDWLIIEMVHNWLDEHINDIDTIVLDGFPRTVSQAQALQKLLQDEFPFCKLRVVVFKVPDEIAVQRLSSRTICSNLSCQAVYSLTKKTLAPSQEGICNICKSPLIQRADDRPEAIRERLKIYHAHEQQIVQFYQSNGFDIIYLEADKPSKQVYDEFIARISIEK